MGLILATSAYKKGRPASESELPTLSSEELEAIFKKNEGLKEAFTYHHFTPSSAYKMLDANSPYTLYFDRNTFQMACISAYSMAFFHLDKMDFNTPIMIEYNLRDTPSMEKAIAKDIASSAGKTVLLSALTFPLGFGINVTSGKNSSRAEDGIFILGFHFQFSNGTYFDIFAYEKPIFQKNEAEEMEAFSKLERNITGEIALVQNRLGIVV